jgi:hypothetical protein
LRFRDNRDVDAVEQVTERAVHPVDDRRAGRAGDLERQTPLARDEHEVVEVERVLAVRIELGERHRPGRRVEDVVPGHLAAERQRAALRGDRLLLAAQLDLRLQQLIARAAVRLGLVRPIHAAAAFASSGTNWSQNSSRNARTSASPSGRAR